MKINKADLETLRTLLESEAQKRGAESLTRWRDKWRAAVARGTLPVPVKCEATACFSYLNTDETLNFVCNTLYDKRGCDDTHLRTAFRKIYSAL